MAVAVFDFEQPDGFRTPVHHWAARSEGRALVLILHGMAEHGARYGETAEALSAADLHVYAPDHRGHGRAIRAEGDQGFFGELDGWNRVVQDALRLTRHLRQRHPGRPVVLLGHSMGSFMAQQLMTQYPATFKGVALSGSDGPVGWLGRAGRQIARLERWRLGKRGRSRVLHGLSFGAFNKPFEPARTPFDWLSRDPEVVDAYIADPLCGFVCTTQLWFDLLGGLLRLHETVRLSRIPEDLPIYVFSGAEDPVSKGGKALEALLALYRSQGLRRVTHHLYPEARHEILNETNRATVRADLLNWIEGALDA